MWRVFQFSLADTEGSRLSFDILSLHLNFWLLSPSNVSSAAATAEGPVSTHFSSAVVPLLTSLVEIYEKVDVDQFRRLLNNQFASIAIRHLLQLLSGLPFSPPPKRNASVRNAPVTPKMLKLFRPLARNFAILILDKVRILSHHYSLSAYLNFTLYWPHAQSIRQLEDSSVPVVGPVKKRPPSSLYDLSYHDCGSLVVQDLLQAAKPLKKQHIFGLPPH